MQILSDSAGTSISKSLKIEQISFADDKIIAHFADGRLVGCPLNWFKNLQKGSVIQRLHYEIAKDGSAIHWPELDEDLSAEGFFTFSPESHQ